MSGVGLGVAGDVPVAGGVVGGIKHMSVGPDRPSTARTVVLSHPQAVETSRTQWREGHVLGSVHATLYGRTGATATELRAIAATALAMADLLDTPE